MSFSEIMKELPALTSEERSTLQRRLRELEEQDELLFLHEAADSMFQEMDKQEVAGARRKTR